LERTTAYVHNTRQVTQHGVWSEQNYKKYTATKRGNTFFDIGDKKPAKTFID